MKKFDHKKARRWVKAAQILFGLLIVLFVIAVMLYGSNSSLAGGPGGGSSSFTGFIEALRGKASALIGTLAVVMTISGGVVYATSQGNPNQMSLGRDLIISAISGLALYAFASFLLGDIGTGGSGGLIKQYFSF